MFIFLRLDTALEYWGVLGLHDQLNLTLTEYESFTIQSNPAVRFSEVEVVHTSDPKSGIYQGYSSLYEFDFFLVFSLLLLAEETFSHVICWQIRATKRKEKKERKKRQTTNIDLFCSCCKHLEPVLICFYHFFSYVWCL